MRANPRVGRISRQSSISIICRRRQVKDAGEGIKPKKCARTSSFFVGCRARGGDWATPRHASKEMALGRSMEHAGDAAPRHTAGGSAYRHNAFSIPVAMSIPSSSKRSTSLRSDIVAQPIKEPQEDLPARRSMVLRVPGDDPHDCIAVGIARVRFLRRPRSALPWCNRQSVQESFSARSYGSGAGRPSQRQTYSPGATHCYDLA